MDKIATKAALEALAQAIKDKLDELEARIETIENGS